MNSRSLMYWNDKHGESQAYKLQFLYNITGAKAISPAVQSYPVLAQFDAIATQAVIDDFLGTTNEFLVAQFDAASMGVNAFGGLVNMGGEKGQMRDGLRMRVASYDGADGGATIFEQNIKFGTLAATSLTTGCELGANGNVGFRAILTGLDALTSGLVIVEFDWLSK